MTAFIVRLTNPAPRKYVLRFKETRDSREQELDLSIDQLRNIIVDGASYAFQHDRRQG